MDDIGYVDEPMDVDMEELVLPQENGGFSGDEYEPLEIDDPLEGDDEPVDLGEYLNFSPSEWNAALEGLLTQVPNYSRDYPDLVGVSSNHSNLVEVSPSEPVIREVCTIRRIPGPDSTVRLIFLLRSNFMNTLLDVLESHYLYERLHIMTRQTYTMRHEVIMICPNDVEKVIRDIFLQIVKPDFSEGSGEDNNCPKMVQDQCVQRFKYDYREHRALENVHLEEAFFFRFILDIFVSTIRTHENDKRTECDIPKPTDRINTSFFDDSTHIANCLIKACKRNPFPSQSQAWPIILQGYDLILIAPRTLGGKTLAHVCPTVALLAANKKYIKGPLDGPLVLVIAPNVKKGDLITREFARYCFDGIRVANLCRWKGEQLNFSKEYHIAVVLPSIWPFVKNGRFVVRHVRLVTVVDTNYMKRTKNLQKAFKIISILECGTQKILISDTWPYAGYSLCTYYMKNPYVVTVEDYDIDDFRALECYTFCFTTEPEKLEALIDFLRFMHRLEKVIVFCRNNSSAAIILELDKYRIDHYLVGNHNLANFRVRGSANFNAAKIVLVDSVDAQLIKPPRTTTVINYNMPDTILDLLYRLDKVRPMGRYINYLTEDDAGHIARDFCDFLADTQKPICYELVSMNRNYDSYKLPRPFY